MGGTALLQGTKVPKVNNRTGRPPRQNMGVWEQVGDECWVFGQGQGSDWVGWLNFTSLEGVQKCLKINNRTGAQMGES